MEERNPSWFKPGKSGNPNGRPKGTKNRFTKETKEYIRKAIGVHIKNLTDDFANMDPADRVRALALMMKFVMTEKKQIDKKVQTDVKVTVTYKKKPTSKELPEASSDAIPFSDYTIEKELDMNGEA